MTTLASLNAATTVALAPLTDSVNPVLAVSANAIDGQSVAVSSPSTVVTIPSSIGIAVLDLYPGGDAGRRYAHGDYGQRQSRCRDAPDAGQL